MCGYVGYLSKDEYSKDVIKNMNDMIVHRGPDSEGYYINDGVYLGHRRLSIIDLSEGGIQPLSSMDESVLIIFNGEIYNYQEIKDDLLAKGYEFKNKTDTEVILVGYQEYGMEGILSKLRGMFSFIIWDKNKKKLFGARDHFGIKPFYYTKADGDFIFGSEVKSFLRHPKFKKEVNEKALKNYLVFQYNPQEETFFKNVYKLRPGHYFEYDFESENMEISQYFDIKFEYEDLGFEKTVEKIHDTVAESIEYHKIADVEVGAFLSGGVDSSYVVSQAMVDKTFSVGFDGKEFNETNYAKELSGMLGIENYSNVISPDDFFFGVEKVQYHSDEPHANLSSVPLYFLSKVAREHVKVVLSGEGADELFAGYNVYEEPNVNRYYSKIPFAIRKKIYDITKEKGHFKGKHIVERFGRNIEDYYIGQAFIMDDKEANSLLTDEYKDSRSFRDLTKKYFDKVRGRDDITKMSYLDMNMWIVDDILLKADKMTMANSLELRVPLLDKEMWNLARTIPTKYKVNKTTTKHAFRKASEKVVPEEWSKRRKKGFPVPFKNYITQEKYYNKVKEMFNKDFVGNFFDVEKINKLLDDHYNGVENNARKVYTIYTFLVWYNIYFVEFV